MAKSYGDGDLWLPPEFLCADFFREGGERCEAGFAGVCIPCEFGLGSNPESPVESATTGPESDEEDYMKAITQQMAPTRPESDEEDYMKAITQQMARYFLRDDDKDASVTAPSRANAMARSPQYALCTRSSLNKGGSLNGPTLVSSPLEQRSEETCDLLDEAPGRLRRRGDLGLCDRRILGPPMTQSPAMSTACKSANAGCYDLGPVLTHRQLQAAHFHHLKRQQAAKQQLSAARGRQCKARDSSVGYAESRCGQPPDLSSNACPPLRKPQHPPPGSGMRAVFLNSSGARKESAGTGVFLPGTAGNKLAPRKKTGCSTVLVPDRVVQVLNLRLEDFAAQPRFPGGFVLTHEALLGRSSAVLSSHEKKNRPLNALPPAAVAEAAAHEIGLPHDWSY